MELKDLIKKYYDSNDKIEKLELRNELLQKKIELDLPLTFDLAVRSHYEAYCASGTKGFLDVMLRHAS